ncbi:MAG: K(+)-transporting ATPase subunit F [Deltaproteobacteria bacterium]|nr:K(+)-transporting ATPase subunit F [Deltaproteobacteria bacterium]
MEALTVVAGGISVLLLGYLVIALLYPEKLS